MDAQKYEQFFLPQYLAPYIPEANSWQEGHPHPKIQLTVEYYTGGNISQTRTRTFLLDIGEESSPGVYSAPFTRTGIIRYSWSCRKPRTERLSTGSNPGSGRMWSSLLFSDVHDFVIINFIIYESI